MKWILFTGTWKLTNQEVENDVREAVQDVMKNGDGILTGGALGVDMFAMEECFRLDNECKKLRIILPTKLDIFLNHFEKAVESGKITEEQCERHENILKLIEKNNPASILEMTFKSISKEEYFAIDAEEVKYSDEVCAFHVNESTGTQHTVEEAIKAGLKIKSHKKYNILEN